MPRAIYIHCMAHRVNLIICDVCLLVPYIDEFFLLFLKFMAILQNLELLTDIFVMHRNCWN